MTTAAELASRLGISVNRKKKKRKKLKTQKIFPERIKGLRNINAEERKHGDHIQKRQSK